ncbi:MAG: methyltransferase [Chitinophagaceae bacterium]
MIIPNLDLAPITRHLRAKASSYLLVSAVHHLNVFEALISGPLSITELQQRLHLKERPVMVLFPALCAMGMLQYNEAGHLQLTEVGRFLSSAEPANLLGYAGLEKQDPGVLKMTLWLRNDGPEDVSQSMSYVKDETAVSPMDQPDTARFFTMALAGRARYLSPVVAGKITKTPGFFLDVAGGTGYYTYEWLMVNPGSQAAVFDRPEVLKVAAQLLDEFCTGEREGIDTLKDRVHFIEGDMLNDDLPKADILLAASLFHDWPTNTCQTLADKFAGALNPGGELWIHDSFLDDTLDGPIAVTDYSAMLFTATKGRAYSRKEYRSWLSAAGLEPNSQNIPTLMDYGLLSARKPVK